ncbi:hypothetical protein [Aeromicrobium massiliense]|uniref:hypothetical protein n=1 Tax=Aeromicrobium massiliense TaxID=1464554 RepID=UPI0006762915|nr:hypothetical protein [Aeromicrobium massiliense]
MSANLDDADGWSSTQSRAPEEHTTFRLAQLAILLGEVAPVGGRSVDLEVLGYYDFFAANPFVVVAVDDARDRARLHQAAFDERQLTYASTGSRFANRRKRLQHDFALMVAYGLAERRSDGYGQTVLGAEFVASMHALYVDQYRASVSIVHARIRSLSPARLGREARHWLSTPSLVLDLYGAHEQSDGTPQTEPGKSTS